MPSSAALIAASVPLKLMLVSLLPVPTLKLSPATLASVTVPLAAVTVSCTRLAPASTSATVMALPVPEENSNAVSSAVACAAGTDSSGASLIALTVIATL